MSDVVLTSLPGWEEDDHAAALAAYLKTAKPEDPARAITADAARDWLAHSFVAQPIATDALLTGYFEPEYPGATEPSGPFNAPVYAPPEGWTDGTPYFSRRDIEARHLLRGRELAWLADPLDVFFLQVQGSGRVRLADGGMMRLGYAGKNGHPYTSLGKLLVERGEIAAPDISMQAIRDWVRANPEAGRELMRENASYVFFRVIEGLGQELGPIGTAGVPLSAGRSVAVDPQHTPLGAFVWIEALEGFDHPGLCVAQDTGSAIIGPGRTDLFCGTGDAAGERAGGLKRKIRAYRLVRREAGS